MPNHISNKLRIIGSDEQVKEVLTFIKDDIEGVGTIDFNKITPMPKWVYGSSPDVIGINLDDKEKWGKENTCLEWSRKHWGTILNAYGQPDIRRTDDTIYFETAWKGIPELMHKIGWIFPDVEIEYSYADEELGSSNNGMYLFKENEIVEETHFDPGSKEAYELGFELVYHGDIPDCYEYDKETESYRNVEVD